MKLIIRERVEIVKLILKIKKKDKNLKRIEEGGWMMNE
jgi:hypothetical protein